jgi:DNA-binding PadR family transcriptional regulator
MKRDNIDTNILAVLARGELHGYGIYKQLIMDGTGTMTIKERSVYRQLPRLVAAGWVEVSPLSLKPVHYRLTPRGRKWLASEKQRMWQLARLINERL